MTRAALVLALVLAACGTSGGNPYQKYRAENPDWDGAFPTKDADVQRTIAALYAPGRNYTVTVQDLKVFMLDMKLEPPHGVVIHHSQLDVIQPEADVGVAAYLHCASSDGTTQFVRGLHVWYLLPNGKLRAYDHYGFRAGCEVTNAFQPAIGRERIAPERSLLKLAGLPAPPQASGALEYYQKGIAFVAAERREDAEAMLAAGDSAGEGGFGVRARFNVPHRADEQSPEEARAALVAALEKAK